MCSKPVMHQYQKWYSKTNHWIMHKEKQIIILPLVSILLMVGGIIFPILFFQSLHRGPGVQGHMYFPFLLACVLGISVFTKSIQNARPLKTWNFTLMLTSVSGVILVLLLFGLIAANVYDLMQAFSK